jgi:hypothetical protein
MPLPFYRLHMAQGQATPIAFAVSSVEPWNDFRRSLWVTSTLGGSVSSP